MSRNIPPLDLMWLVMETPAEPTHVGALLVFERPPGRPAVVQEIVTAYRKFTPTPPFNCVPVLGRGVPRFVEAQNIDPDYHVRHLAMPAGSSYEDFLRVVADLHEPVLDRARPLFRTWVIEGLPGRRFAIYSKVSHSIIDGASGARRIYASLSTSPRSRIPPPSFAARVGVRKERPPKPLGDRLAAMRTTATRQVAALKDVYLGVLRKSASELAGSKRGGSRPFTAHRSPMNEPLQAARSFATLSLPLEELRDVGRRFNATLNDVVVSIVDEGTHRYLRQHGREFRHRLVAMVPMSLRDEGDDEAATKASAMFVHLGTHDARIADRMAQVVDAMNEAKQELRSMTKDSAMLYATATLGLNLAGNLSRVGRLAPPLANLIISNVPGARQTMYLNGARLLGTYAVPGVAMSIGLNVTVSSYADSMDFGFGGNGAVMRSLPDLARHVESAYQDLQAAARRGSAKRTAQAKRRRASSKGN